MTYMNGLRLLPDQWLEIINGTKTAFLTHAPYAALTIQLLTYDMLGVRVFVTHFAVLKSLDDLTSEQWMQLGESPDLQERCEEEATQGELVYIQFLLLDQGVISDSTAEGFLYNPEVQY